MRLTGAAAAGASPEEQHPQTAFGWVARDASGVLSPFSFSRRATGDDDVKMKIPYCGICHSDLHAIKNEWQSTMNPIVAGHAIVGVATVGKVGDEVGKLSLTCRQGVATVGKDGDKVGKLSLTCRHEIVGVAMVGKVGDKGGVGCMVRACDLVGIRQPKSGPIRSRLSAIDVQRRFLFGSTIAQLLKNDGRIIGPAQAKTHVSFSIF